MPPYGTVEHNEWTDDISCFVPTLIRKGELGEFVVATQETYFCWWPEPADDPIERIKQRKKIKGEWLIRDIIWAAVGKWVGPAPKGDWRELLKCKNWAEWDKYMAPTRALWAGSAFKRPCAEAYSRYTFPLHEDPNYKNLSLMDKARVWRARAEKLQNITTTAEDDPAPSSKPTPTASDPVENRSTTSQSTASTSSAATRICKRKAPAPAFVAPKAKGKTFADSNSKRSPSHNEKRAKKPRKMSGVEVLVFNSDGEPAGFVETWDSE